MKLSASAVVFVLLLAPLALAAADDEEAAEHKKLVGTWHGYAVEGRGENPDRGPVKLVLTITMDRITGLKDGKQDVGEGAHKLDLTKQPKRLDATRTRKPGTGRTHLGIYKLDGDTLNWCVANWNKPLPTDFVTRKGQYLLILKRKKD